MQTEPDMVQAQAADRAEVVGPRHRLVAEGSTPSPSVHRRAPRAVGARAAVARLAAIVVLVGAASMFVTAVWPGRMSADTLAQISSVRSGQYSDWHAGLLMVLWRPFWLLGVGPGLVTWIGAVTFVLGLYGVARCVLARAGAVVAALGVTALPQVLGYVGYLGRDLWFTALFLVSAAALGWLARAHGRGRRLPLLVVIVALWLMMASRQNALPVAGVLILGGLWVCGPWPWLGRFDRAGTHRRDHVRRRHSARPRRVRATVAAAAVRTGAAFAILLVLFASQAVAKRVFDVRSTHPEQATFIYDLAVLSHRERQVLFSPEIFPAQDLAVLDAAYSPTNVNPLLFGENAPIPFPVPDEHIDTLRDDWLGAVVEHPWGYFRERWRMWETQVAWTGKTEWVYHPAIDPNPWGYGVANPPLNDAVQDYLRTFAANDRLEGGLVHEVWVYLLVTTLALGYLLARRQSRQLLGWFCLASLAYQSTIFIGAMGVGYRFHLPTVILAVIVTLAVLRDGSVALAGFARSRHLDSNASAPTVTT